MPTSNANTTGNSDFYGFPTPSNSDGVAWLGSWWPTSGRRGDNSATFYTVGSYGVYWSASPYPSSNPYTAYYLTFNSGNVNPAYNTSRSFGMPVRCVQE